MSKSAFRRAVVLVAMVATSLPIAATVLDGSPAQAAPLPCDHANRPWGYILLNYNADPDVYDRDASPQFSSGPLYNSLTITEKRDGVLGNDRVSETESAVDFDLSVALVTGPSHAASFTLNENGTFTYVPVAGYLGADSFAYVFHRNNGPCSNVAIVTIAPARLARAVDDTYTAYTDTPLEVGKFVCSFFCGVIDNDLVTTVDPGSNSYTRVQAIVPWNSLAILPGIDNTLPGPYSTPHGTLTQVSHNGSFVYTPNPGYVGTDTFKYRLSTQSPFPVGDFLGLGGHKFFSETPSRYGQVTINVVPPPAPDVPKAADDKFTIIEDTMTNIQGSAMRVNDPNATFISSLGSILYSGQLSVRTPHGQVTIIWREIIPGDPFQVYVDSIYYTPDANFTGIDWFTYTVKNAYQGAVSAPVTVYLEVEAVEDPPVANLDAATIDEDMPTTIDLAANDTDPDGNLVASSIIKDPCNEHLCAPVGWDLYLHGSWVLNGDGTVTYTPTADFSGEAVFLYEIRDTTGRKAYGRATVTVRSDDAVDDSVAATEDTLLSVNAPGVLANDDSPATAVALLSDASHGALTLNADGSFSYQPDLNFAGADSFTYQAAGDIATVTIDVAPVNDPPVVLLNGWCDRTDPLLVCLGFKDARDIVEGGSAVVRGAIVDVEFAKGTLEVDWGDGTTTSTPYPCDTEDDACAFSVDPTWNTGCSAINCPDPLFFELHHTYTDDPAGSPDYVAFEVTATEKNGLSGSTTGQGRVSNAAPTLSISADCSGDGVVCLGSFSRLNASAGVPNQIAGRVTDVGADDGTITIDWGDATQTVIDLGCGGGSTVCPTTSQHTACVGTSAGCGYFASQHQYAQSGDFTVTVTVDDGDSGVATDSRTAHATVASTSPGAPTGLTATRSGASQLTVAFTPPASDGGSTITSYRVECTSTDGGTTRSATGAGSPLTVTSLDLGRTYTCRATATNASGTGNLSDPSASVLIPAAATTPGAPTNIVAVRAGAGRFSVAFTPPTNDGGSPITSYRVVCTSNNGGTTRSATGTTSPLLVTALTAGRTYTCRATATNAIGTGAISLPSASVVAPTAPAPPTSLVATRAGAGRFSVAFTPPTNDGGSPITSYRVVCTSNNGGTTRSATGTTSPVAVTALTAGRTYTCRATATNGVGTSVFSLPSAALTTPSAPAAPTRVIATRAGAGRFSVAFTPPTNDGGSPITSYRVVCTSNNGGTTRSATGTTSPLLVTALTGGRTYTCRATATNAVGTGAQSARSAAVVAPR